MHIHDLETPAVVIDLDILERNIRRLAEYTSAHRIHLRPHIKTHKIPELARMQLSHGAIGVTAAKIGEARVMAEAGISDILIAYPIVSRVKAQAIGELLETTQITVAVDSAEAAECLSRGAAGHARRLKLLVEIDVGFGRCGVGSPETAVALGRQIAALPNVELAGLMYYPGHMFVPGAQQDILLPAVNERVAAAWEAFHAAGLPVTVVSGGSTPTAYRSHEFQHVTEIRPGMYLLNDRNLVQGGFATVDECALSVIVSVVSIAVQGKAILDGGSKTFSSDRLLTGDGVGCGLVREDPLAGFMAMSEEHGHLDLSRTPRRYRIGERLHVIPNHVCTTINMHDRVYAIRGEGIEEVWAVAARGLVQ